MPSDRKTRFEYGRDAEFLIYWRISVEWGCKIERCGQEYWQPGFSQNVLRAVHDNPVIDAIRHFPDFHSGSMYVQAKSAPDWNGHPSVTIEQKSFDVSKSIMDSGIPVLIIWHFPEKKPGFLNDHNEDMLANYVDLLKPTTPNIERHEMNGAMTPAYLIGIEQLVPFRYFEDHIHRAIMMRRGINQVAEAFKRARNIR